MPKANVLFGVLLHGADRLRQGEELTDLEHVLLGVLRESLGDEEVGEWGRVYRESVSARGAALTGVPGVITGRSVSEGYGFADLAEDMPAVTAEWSAQSNWSAVAPESLAAGEAFDSPEFTEGMREWGWAVTVPADLTAQSAGDEPQEPQENDERAGLYRVRLDYENFHVHREVGDGWPGTRDEIRWISGGQSDTRQHAVPYLSQEFGGHQTDRGQTPAFTGHRTAFHGDARLGLVLSVACWEWDTGDGNDDSFREVMNRLNENLLFNLIWDAIGTLSPDLIGYLMDLTSMAITITNLIARNDLSAARSLYLDQKALAALSHTGSAQWHFAGDGHHELKVRFTGDKIPFPANDLQCVIRTDTTWSAPTTLPFQGLSGPTLAVHDNKLYLFYIRTNDQAVMWASMDTSGNWTTPARVSTDRSWHAPGVTSANGRLYYAVTGMDNKVYTRTFASGTWRGHDVRPGSALHSPALAALGGQPWMVVCGLDDRLYLARHNGTAWNAWSEDNLDWRVDTHVALAPHGNQLCRIATGKDQRIYTSVSTNSGWVNGGIASPNWRASHAPALAANTAANTLAILMRGTDGALWAGEFSGSWHSAHRVPGAAAKEAAAAAYFNNKPYVMYVDRPGPGLAI
ncbi:hypothetical protein OG304_38350 [Streptomyces sp. NBC_00160]|uniref:hypothetical protein n=1 Tax=Streptomyces TaxID=1883 RepID=UPI00207AA5B2|nr:MULTISPECIES: hypothetical protein [Streptomyces]MCM9077373.1 hypothetical protein [Streptomyces spororaveus]MCM9077382.1 hypothetical protein [Streptomyces spororaveus]MCX5309225.1 hypothetical protein [Streptomyces sp. NBC_00160]